MMEFITSIKITPLKQPISYGDGILFLGSCFADEVGSICRGLGFNAQVNPFGVLYNPVSIANAVQRLHSGKPFSQEEVVKVGEEFFCTFSHNTDFWSSSEETLINNVNDHLAKAHEHFAQSKWIVLSLGTACVYRYRATQEVVANCHKLPSQLFDHYCLSVEAVSKCLSDLLQAFPERQFIFTVSPLRHLKDGLHGNQLSKSTLLLAVNEVCGRFNNAHYFPAYEILLDELRDYRFYKEDMIHPTDQAVRYIWEKFFDFAIDPSEKPAMQAAMELRQMLHHKPFFPESDVYGKFELQREKKQQDLVRNYPKIIIENISSS